MLEKQQVISDLRREFPQFLSRLGRWEDDQTQRFSMPVFAHFVIDQLYEHDNDERVRAAFAQMEKFLRDGSQEVRNLVGLGFLETLHNLASWKSYGSEAFVRFLGPETRPRLGRPGGCVEGIGQAGFVRPHYLGSRGVALAHSPARSG